MNKDKTFAFQQRWRQIAGIKKDLDWKITEFSADLRSEFPDGATGDKQLIKWSDVELGMPSYVAQELLLRANTHTTVGDKKKYESVGGFNAVRQVARLPKRQQVHVIQSALDQNKNVRSVMREQGLIEEPKAVLADNPDAKMLAQFILDNVKTQLPPRIHNLCVWYTKGAKRAA